MKYYILIRFQGREYRTMEVYDSYAEASDEAHRRFGIYTAVQWDVFTDEATL